MDRFLTLGLAICVGVVCLILVFLAISLVHAGFVAFFEWLNIIAERSITMNRG